MSGGGLPLELNFPSPLASSFPLLFLVLEGQRRSRAPGLIRNWCPGGGFWGGRWLGRVARARARSLAVGESSCWPMETGVFRAHTPAPPPPTASCRLGRGFRRPGGKQAGRMRASPESDCLAFHFLAPESGGLLASPSSPPRPPTPPSPAAAAR